MQWPAFLDIIYVINEDIVMSREIGFIVFIQCVVFFRQVTKVIEVVKRKYSLQC